MKVKDYKQLYETLLKEVEMLRPLRKEKLSYLEREAKNEGKLIQNKIKEGDLGFARIRLEGNYQDIITQIEYLGGNPTNYKEIKDELLKEINRENGGSNA